MIHRIIEGLRRFLGAVRHVRSGGESTRARARSRAERPPRTCRACHQPLVHSTDWRDHLQH